MQGLFGIFPFTVTEAEVCTFRDFKMNRELAYAEHKCLSGLSKLQHTGRNLDTVSLNVQIVPLGVISTVEARLRLLQGLSLLGTELPLVIGLKNITACSRSNHMKFCARPSIMAFAFALKLPSIYWSTIDGRDHGALLRQTAFYVRVMDIQVHSCHPNLSFTHYIQTFT